ncbi:DUF2497 domain-containing protein [Microvirga thermotolerans]|nr:DUF2497 domain-containing protein [Microvirga thermotolerans]
MNAVSPKAHEPSMEEILASIRRIIADDQEGLQTPEADRGEAAPLRAVREARESQVIPLTPPDERDPSDPFDGVLAAMVDDIPASVAEFPQAKPAKVDGLELRSAAPVSGHAAPASPTAEVRGGAPARSVAGSQDALLSGAADACVADAFGRLGAAVAGRSSPATMEDFVAELLRPLLREWLDENLPPLVERLVRAEIERISRGVR